MAKVVKELSVKMGKYVDAQGQEKHRWRAVGRMMKDDQGGFFILLDKSFSPAGVPGDAFNDQILISMFDPKQRTQPSPPQQPQPTQNDYDDEPPF